MYPIRGASMTWSRTSHRRYRSNRARVIRNSDTCAICGKPLDKSIPWPDPWCTTTDHVVPIADGGHNLGTLQAAHRICNQKRWQQAGKTRHGRSW